MKTLFSQLSFDLALSLKDANCTKNLNPNFDISLPGEKVNKVIILCRLKLKFLVLGKNFQVG